MLAIIPVGTTVLVDQDKGQPFDSYGRIVAVVYKDGINVNAELLKKGKATLFKRYCEISEFGRSDWAARFGCKATTPESRTKSWTFTTSKMLTKASKTTTIQESSTETEKTTSSESTTKTVRSYRGCIKVVTFHYNAAGNDNQNLNDEYVTLENTCDFPIDMSGWRLTDSGAKHVYRFKTFVLRPGATVTLHSGRGFDTTTDLYWGRSYGAVWNNDGDTLYLYDSSGQLVLVYRY